MMYHGNPLPHKPQRSTLETVIALFGAVLYIGMLIAVDVILLAWTAYVLDTIYMWFLFQYTHVTIGRVPWIAVLMLFRLMTHQTLETSGKSHAERFGELVVAGCVRPALFLLIAYCVKLVYL